MTKLQDPSMWTPAHWKLFDAMEQIRRNDFNSNYQKFKNAMLDGGYTEFASLNVILESEFNNDLDEFKKHMDYILNVMDHMYPEGSGFHDDSEA